jgi:alkylation response protein AidB-like acyl-CoA dehydrogenase
MAVAFPRSAIRREEQDVRLVLNGVKHFISNGTVASWYVFATRDHALRNKGIPCSVFPPDLPGTRKNRMKHKLGQRAAKLLQIYEGTSQIQRVVTACSLLKQ